MDNQEKLETLGTQDTTRNVLDIAMRKQTKLRK
jgi:hypothetical protein